MLYKPIIVAFFVSEARWGSHVCPGGRFWDEDVGRCVGRSLRNRGGFSARRFSVAVEDECYGCERGVVRHRQCGSTERNRSVCRSQCGRVETLVCSSSTVGLFLLKVVIALCRFFFWGERAGRLKVVLSQWDIESGQAERNGS